jgi:hypothetical protein
MSSIYSLYINDMSRLRVKGNGKLICKGLGSCGSERCRGGEDRGCTFRSVAPKLLGAADCGKAVIAQQYTV